MGTTTTANLMVTVALLIIAATSDVVAAAYTNHTVGDVAGWFFNTTTSTSSANYSAWASTQTFNLGDYLIFKTTSNQSVVQTYNVTTYQSCSTDELDINTFIYDGGSNEFNQPLTIDVPLTIQGLNYFFSDSDDGAQCQQGMAFEIVVNHGQGLPPSLSQPPPPPYMEPPPPDTAQSPPVTIPGGQPNSDGGEMRSVANVRVLVCVVLLMLV